MSKNTSVYGILPTQAQLTNCLENLRLGGFRPEDVSLLMPENLGNKDLGHERNSKAPEGAATGGAAGGVLGGGLGWLVGIGALTIPGLGPLMVAGPIVAALAGAGAGAALGGVAGGLIGLGMPEYEAKRYEGRIRKGGILISVHCDDKKWAERAEGILSAGGAEDISSSSQAPADYQETERPVPR